MRFRQDEDGQALVLTALSLAVLLGFVALAVDVGLLLRNKRNMQIAADAGSTAGALDYYNNESNGDAIAAGQTAVTNAGLTGASFGCPAAASGSAPGVCVRSPATNGVHTGEGYVEVDVVNPNRTTFMSLFGVNTVNVAARSVAGLTAGQGCIWVKNNFNVQGNASLCGLASGSTTFNGCGTGNSCGTTPPACGAYVGGSITGSGGGGGSNCIYANYVETSGTVGINVNPSPAVAGVGTQTPPAFLTQTPPAMASPCNLPPGGTWGTFQGVNIYTATLTGSLSPGCYGLSNVPSAYAGNADIVLTITNATLSDSTNNGLYQFDLGNVTIGNGSSAVNGGTLTIGSNVTGGTTPIFDANGIQINTPAAGVTLEINTGNFTVNSTSTGIDLYAPAEPGQTNNGIVLWEPGSNTGTINIQWGSGSGNFYGYIVAPGSTLSMQDQGASGIVTGLYVGNFALNSSLGFTNYNTVVTTSPGKTVALVE